MSALVSQVKPNSASAIAGLRVAGGLLSWTCTRGRALPSRKTKSLYSGRVGGGDVEVDVFTGKVAKLTGVAAEG